MVRADIESQTYSKLFVDGSDMLSSSPRLHHSDNILRAYRHFW